MPLRKLENYLRTHRKRVGLTQDEVAYLLGRECGTQVSRYERFKRQPSLTTVVAYEVIFGAAAQELFAGVAERIKPTIQKRARSLTQRLQAGKQTRMVGQKLAFLETVGQIKSTAPNP
jgi:transcriptional regulator with XRE-family HTH domain